MDKELLYRFLNDQCTPEEVEIVTGWISTESDSLQGRALGLEDWHNYFPEGDLMEKEKYSLLLDRIHHRINLRNSGEANQRKVVRIFNWVTRVAVVLMIPVMVFQFYQNRNDAAKYSSKSIFGVDSLEIVAPIGSKTIVQLSDGSVVYLNHGSKLKYPPYFDGDTRQVTLAGEGYFEIAPNPRMPFIVNAGDLRVAALGTSFNVMAYPDDNVIETTLVEGEVALGVSGRSFDVKSMISMLPGQHISYNKNTREAVSIKGNIDRYTAWKDGRMIFKNESIVQIAGKLSRWYNVEFEFRDQEVMEYTYTATFNDETIIQILDLMKSATPINYKILPREKLKDNTFSKQKIILEKRK